MAKYCIVFLLLQVPCLLSEEILPISQRCLGCLCYGASICQIAKNCTGDLCGPFKIGKLFWKEVEMGETTSEDEAFLQCALSLKCAALTVEKYMRKFRQDCNGDGRVDCDDYVLIHRHGGYGCKGTELPIDDFTSRFKFCKTKVRA